MKTYQSWLLGALACATIVPFTGCTKDEMVGPNGGNGETFETELTIALTSGKGKSTKATDQEVQDGTSTFNGMNEIYLLTYTKEGSGITGSDNFAAEGTETILSKHKLLDIDPANTTSGTNYVKYNYRQPISLQKETQAFLFYGKSAYANPIGKLKATLPDAEGYFSNIEFDLEGLEDESAYKITLETYLKDVYLKLYAFNPDYVLDDNHQVGTTDASIIDMYNNFKSAKSGSFVQIADFMAQLYVLANADKLTGDGTNDDNDKAALLEAIFKTTDNETIFSSAPSTTGSSTAENILENMTYTIKSDNPLLTALAEEDILDAYYELSFCEHGSNGETDDFLSASITNTYTSPAALYYYVNTYPADYSTGNFEGLSWVNGEIQTYTFVNLATATPSKIALAHSVQYGVGRLDVEFAVSGNLDDNDGDEGTTISSDNLKLKGVLIGNQKSVGWNFTPKEEGVEKVIYDNVVDTDAKTAKVLALPTAERAKVKVALELEYTGDAPFIGANGQKIPAHSTFYVVGELDPTKDEGVKDEDNHETVFMSDYITKAKLTLSSVKSAQNTVPDLSSSSLEFALSVDLSWQSGLEFDVTIP